MSVDDSEALGYPSGFVTFLFTDIEGSTRLLSRHGGALGPIIATHFEILAAAVDDEEGVVFETVGDAVYAAFRSPASALRAAAEMLRRVAIADWRPIDELRIRIAIHSGEVMRRGTHYFGASLFECSRIQSLAWGEQALVSATTAEALRGESPHGLSLRALGRHWLKDLAEPLEVYQIAGPMLRAEFPPLRSSRGAPSNLPSPLTSFIGRSRELEELSALIETARLVTLIGSGGAGKTRLALQAAAGAQTGYRDGVFLFELAAVREAADIGNVIASVLGIRPRSPQTAVEAVIDYLVDRQILLVLDNLEQISGSAPVIRQLLEAGPGVRVLATSRQAVGTAGERRYPVLPLRPDDEAVDLFIERARDRTPAWEPNGSDLQMIGEICARLDGLPLAIELAVARLPLLGMRGLLDGLGQRLALLSDRDLGLPERQRTLRDTVGWSVALLGSQERTAFEALAVFSSAFDLSAANTVMDRPAPETMDLVGALLDKSLLVALEDVAGQPRFAMLETIREYAAERLQAGVAEVTVRDRHLGWITETAEQMARWLVTDGASAALSRLSSILEDVRRAIAWAATTGNGAAACRIAGSLWRYGYLTGQFEELCTLGAMATGNHTAHDEPRARALNALACGLAGLGEFVDAEQALGEAEEILVLTGPIEMLADVVNSRGHPARLPRRQLWGRRLLPTKQRAVGTNRRRLDTSHLSVPESGSSADVVGPPFGGGYTVICGGAAAQLR